MLTQRFTWLIVIRVLILTAVLGILLWIWGDVRLFFTQIILVIVIIAILAELIRFVNTSNREMARFLFAIRHGDLSVNFKYRPLGSSFLLLQQQMTELADAYRNVKIEKEAQYQLLQALVDRISVGIIILTEDNVTLINGTAQRLLNVGTSQDWKLIRQQNPAFTEQLIELGDEGRKLIEVQAPTGNRMISTDVATMLILGRPSKLITLQDINAEIEQKELEAWHKLIRILTHEIMNSITPIASLTETMQGMLTNGDGTRKLASKLNDETVADILFSLNTIHVRSEGLLDFVENYRKLTRVPKPNFAPVDLNGFVASVHKLMEDTAQRSGVTFNARYTRTDIKPSFDAALIQQVLINLISNAVYATEEVTLRRVQLSAFVQDKQLIFEVTDTGKGIPVHLLREIFVPFYSTRTDGSGIGLSLSKQIVSSHRGNITVHSTPGEGTTFTVALPVAR
ncbi:ATP-binding protein [Chryseolinea sp. T2]|uniref:sensor histidine kinase n=1 Tax=Chryseolinea sp. T2 TaxID=3129255 RepID=UPI0030777DB4